MATIGSLIVKLQANTAQFMSKMSKSTKGVRGFSRGILGASKRLIGFSAAFTGVAGGGMMLMIKRQMDLIDLLAKTSEKLGLTTEALAGLRHAAELTGVGTKTLDMALQRMTRRIAEAAQGTGEAMSAIKELGLDAGRLAAMSPDEAFRKIAGAMKLVKGQSNKVRLAFKLFDSEGVAVVNTLALGEEGLKKAAAEAKRFGLAISKVDAAKITQANDAVTRMKASISGFFTRMAVELAPYIKMISDDLTSAFVGAGRAAGTASGDITGLTLTLGLLANTLHLVGLGFDLVAYVIYGALAMAAKLDQWLDKWICRVLNLERSGQALSEYLIRTFEITKERIAGKWNEFPWARFERIAEEMRKIAKDTQAFNAAMATTGEGAEQFALISRTIIDLEKRLRGLSKGAQRAPIIQMIADLTKHLEGLGKEAKTAGKAFDDLGKTAGDAIGDLITKWEDDIATFDFSSRERAIFDALGAPGQPVDPAALDELKKLDRILMEMEKRRADMETHQGWVDAGRAFAASIRTPMEEFEKQKQDLGLWFGVHALNGMQYWRGMQKARKEYLSSIGLDFEKALTPMEEFLEKAAKIKEELARKMLDPAEAAIAYDNALKGLTDTAPQREEPRFAAAMEYGSREAYSAIVRARGGGGVDPLVQIREDGIKRTAYLRRLLGIQEEIRDKEETVAEPPA